MAGKSYLDYDGLKHLVRKINTAVESAMPAGTVVMWSGSADEVPYGWALCDGQNGTPDLRGRFVLVADDDHLAGTTGGEATHLLTVEELPTHTHTASGIATTESTEGGSLFSGGEDLIGASDSGETGETGGNTPFSIMPPYYAMAYIMKLTPEATVATYESKLNEYINSVMEGEY